jgi:hypothetical protein
LLGTAATAWRHRIRALAEQLEVRRLIIDEIHALLVGTPRQQRIILTVIRLLANDLRIPMVCLGIEEANRAWMPDDQLDSQTVSPPPSCPLGKTMRRLNSCG